jgi:hypothetical protein
MNLKHFAVFVSSALVFIISISLFSDIFQNKNEFISELLSLYSIGAIAGCGLAATWLMGEFVDQDWHGHHVPKLKK